MDARLAEILESYRGREKIIRLAVYSCSFVGGLLNNTKLSSLGRSLTILSGNLNETRTILRLFDDVSMWIHCKNYGLGLKVLFCTLLSSSSLEIISLFGCSWVVFKRV